MKRKIKIRTLLLFLGLISLIIACTPEKTELGAILDKSSLKFSVTQDSENPNKFILKSETPNVTPFWITPVGRSIKVTDTIVIPFPGKDTIYYSVESDGGLAQADPYIFEVSTIDSAYVSTEMWVNLAGGYNQSKTWVLDIDADGLSKLFAGPLYFAGANYSWEWDAGWADWIMPKGDYGTMTFNLIGAPNFSSDNKMVPGLSGSGTFMLYPDKMLLSTFGAEVIHDNSQGGQVPNWKIGLIVKTLTADKLQLVAVRDDGTWLIYNYLSKEYYDSH